jgi:hypothetical protein
MIAKLNKSPIGTKRVLRFGSKWMAGDDQLLSPSRAPFAHCGNIVLLIMRLTLSKF